MDCTQFRNILTRVIKIKLTKDQNTAEPYVTKWTSGTSSHNSSSLRKLHSELADKGRGGLLGQSVGGPGQTCAFQHVTMDMSNLVQVSHRGNGIYSPIPLRCPEHLVGNGAPQVLDLVPAPGTVISKIHQSTDL